MEKILKFEHMPLEMQKLVSKISDERKSSLIFGSAASPFLVAIQFLRGSVPPLASNIETVMYAGTLTAMHKMNSATIRGKMTELERHLKRRKFSEYRKGTDVFIVYGKNIHFIPGSRFKIAVAKAQKTFLKHFIPYRAIGILKSKKFSSTKYEQM